MFQIVDKPLMPPGGCINCGCKAPRDGRRYVDTCTQVFNYGRIYVCEWCLKEWGQGIGLVDESIFKTMSDAFNDAVSAKLKLESENERLRGVFATLNDLNINIGSSGIDSEDDAKEPGEDQSTVESPAQSVAKISPRSSAKPAGLAKSVAKPGPTNISKSDGATVAPGTRL